MRIDDQTYELIEKYLGGLLSAEQTAAFEQRLQGDAELADQVTIFKMMPNYLQEDAFPDSTYEQDHPKAKAYLDELLKEDTRALKDHLNLKSENFLNNTSSHSTMGVWRVLRVAAVLLIMVAAATFLFRPSEPERLYSRYAEHEDLVLNIRGDGDQLAQQAETLFNAGKFGKALPILTQLHEQMEELEEPRYDLQLAMGIAQVETGMSDQAIQTFTSIYNTDALIRDDALFYQALTELRSGNKEAASTILETVKNTFPTYKTDIVNEILLQLAGS